MKQQARLCIFFVSLIVITSRLTLAKQDTFMTYNTSEFKETTWSGDLLGSLATYDNFVYIGGDFSENAFVSPQRSVVGGRGFLMRDQTDPKPETVHVHHLVRYNMKMKRFEALPTETTQVPAIVRCMGVSSSGQLFIAGDRYDPGHNQEKRVLVGRWQITDQVAPGDDWIFFGPTHLNSSTVPLTHEHLDDTQQSVRALYIDESELTGPVLYIAYANQIFRTSAANNWQWKVVAPLPDGSMFIESFVVHDSRIYAAMITNHHYDEGPENWHATVQYYNINESRPIDQDHVWLKWGVTNVPDFTSIAQIEFVTDNQLVVSGWHHGHTIVLAAHVQVRNSSSVDFTWRSIFQAEESNWEDYGNYTAPIFQAVPSQDDDALLDLIIGGYFELHNAGADQNETVSSIVRIPSQWQTDPYFHNNKTHLTTFGVNNGLHQHRINALVILSDGQMYLCSTDLEREPREITIGDYVMLGFILSYGLISIIGTLFMIKECNREGCCFKCFKCGTSPSHDYTKDIFDEEYSEDDTNANF
mmetsp:Transcript_11640/g.17470  ORF Transcript_11640/g.17470 Transcript_11640/m.17470 type:complete len:529 (+) Transcript_11640:480-2066(+)